MTRSLITGAAGLIGFALAQRLAARGDELVIVDDYTKGGRADVERLVREHSNVHAIEHDLARGMPPLPDARPFDVVHHLAALVGVAYVNAHPWETIDRNLRSTLAVFTWARETRPGRVLFASSSENYASGVEAGTVPIPTREDVPLSIADPALPRWSYAASKIAGESALFAAAGDANEPRPSSESRAASCGHFTPIVARVHNVYGPRMGPTHVIPELFTRLANGVDPLPVLGIEQTRSFLHVDDAARALELLGDRAEAGIWHVGSEEELSIGALVERMFATSGRQVRIDARPAPPGSVARRAPDTQKLRALGFAPRVPLEQGLRECWASAQARRAREASAAS